VLCAGGIVTPAEFAASLRMGYAGAQLGTRFIATTECRASEAYKAAILRAGENDIVLSERITGVPVAVIRTPYIERLGLRAGPISRRLLRGRRTRHFMRTLYALRSLWQLKRASLDETGARDYWQAGRSVAGIDTIEPAGVIVRRFADAALATRSRP
jgi:nitronate monooxygenase